MAHIVPFKASVMRDQAADQDAEIDRTKGAQIVIFPGVRRERHAEAIAQPLDDRDPARDWLDLPEAPPSASL